MKAKLQRISLPSSWSQVNYRVKQDAMNTCTNCGSQLHHHEEKTCTTCKLWEERHGKVHNIPFKSIMKEEGRCRTIMTPAGGRVALNFTMDNQGFRKNKTILHHL